MVWCQNCLLIFPLRGGAQVLAGIILAYSLAGGIFLFMFGPYLYFTFPEPQIYGGISMAFMSLALLHIIAYANISFMWTRLVFLISPIFLFLGAVRAGLMIFRLDYYKDDIAWECQHGGQLYNATIANITASDPGFNWTAPAGTRTIPASFCNTGFNTVYLAFAFCLAIDLALQIYQYFMIWRFKASLHAYFALKQSDQGIYST